jgi:hypothetical protein
VNFQFDQLGRKKKHKKDKEHHNSF